MGELGTGDLDEFRRAGHALVDAVADHLAALPGRPVWQPLPDGLRAELLSLPLPDGPTDLGPLAATMARDVLPYAMGNGHPAFFGWVNPPPSLAGVLASLAAAAMNPSVVSGDHADVHLERSAVRWLAELVGYPHAPGAGLLTSGASAATIVCLAGARAPRGARRAPGGARRRPAAALPTCRRRPTAACRARSSCSGSAASRSGPCRSRAGASTPSSCAPPSRPTAPRAARRPCWSVPPAPSTRARSTRSRTLADVAAAEGLWFHVDGAYGAFGVLDPAIAARYRGMERADSLTLDPHKWLGVPVDAGCALVRRADDLREAFSMVPPYLRQDAGAEVGTFAEYGLEQTRPFRALKTWATIAARGRDGIVAQVVRANALARELAAMVEREPSLELAAAPGDLDRGVPGPAARLRAGGARGGQPRSARGRPGARAGVRDRHGLRGSRDPARLHPAPGHDRGRPGAARRRGARRRCMRSPTPGA